MNETMGTPGAVQTDAPCARDRRALLRLTPAATYRKLAAELRAAGRAKTDAHARAVLNKAADAYDAFAVRVEDVQRFRESVPLPGSTANARP